MYILHVFTLVCKTPCIRTSQLQALYKTKYHSAYIPCRLASSVCSVFGSMLMLQQVGFVHAHLMANGENCTMHTYNTYNYTTHTAGYTLHCDHGVCWFPIYM